MAFAELVTERLRATCLELLRPRTYFAAIGRVLLQDLVAPYLRRGAAVPKLLPGMHHVADCGGYVLTDDVRSDEHAGYAINFEDISRARVHYYNEFGLLESGTVRPGSMMVGKIIDGQLHLAVVQGNVRQSCLPTFVHLGCNTMHYYFQSRGQLYGFYSGDCTEHVAISKRAICRLPCGLLVKTAKQKNGRYSDANLYVGGAHVPLVSQRGPGYPPRQFDYRGEILVDDHGVVCEEYPCELSEYLVHWTYIHIVRNDEVVTDYD